jgi:general secretion pathway protein J
MRQRGFTLLELLAAMAVLAVLGALGFRGLSSVLEAESRLQAETRRWNDLALLFSQLGEDTTMAVERPVRELAGRTSPALSLQAPTDPTHPYLVLTRLGIGEGSAAQSAQRRVGYRLREGKLEYLVWPSPDGAPGVRPAAYVALEHVASMHWEALDADGRWVNAWPAGRAANVLPRAISVRLALAGGDEVTRILALR